MSSCCAGGGHSRHLLDYKQPGMWLDAIMQCSAGGASTASRAENPIFHERQSPLRFQCACHALNNLFGECWLDADSMDSFAKGLPDLGDGDLRSSFGAWLGNWDLQVIVAALQFRGARVAVHLVPPSPEVVAGTASEEVAERENKRLKAALQEAEDVACSSKVFGVIVNQPGQDFFRRAFGWRHWYTIAPRNNSSNEECWWDLDSNRHYPALISDSKGVPGSGENAKLPNDFLWKLLQEECQLFVVVEDNSPTKGT